MAKGENAARPPLKGASRRMVLAAIGVALAPRSLRAQTPRAGMPRLGVLLGTRASDPEGQARAAVIVAALAEHHWIEGANLRIDWRWTGSEAGLFERYAAEMVALGPEVLLTFGSAAVEALRRQTKTIPIVFASVTDPVGQGFVASVAAPGGNITGFSDYDPPMVGKWLGMLSQISPPIARVAVLYNPAVAPWAGAMLRAIDAAARSVAVTARAAPVNDVGEIESAMSALAGESGGLLILPDSFNTVHRGDIIGLAARHRLPAVYPYRAFTASDGLMSYGTEVNDLYRRSVSYVDRILRGAKPAELPVQAPTKFALVINLKTAKALGISIAPALLATADQVIE